jgi:hypothetical protein
MKIWGRANSINVQKVLWAAAECGLKYERTDVGGPFGGNDQKWYLDMNPNGVVPTVDDGGRIIWESNSAVSPISIIGRTVCADVKKDPHSSRRDCVRRAKGFRYVSL